MYWESRAKCKRIMIVFLCFTAMVVFLKNSTCQKTALSKGNIFKKTDCPLDELFDYLSEKGAEASYAYAQISIKIDDYQYQVQGHDYHVEIMTDWEGTASILWHTFSSAGEFQEYAAAQENAAPKKKDADALEFVYYQYRLEEDDHAVDLYQLLEERDNGGDEKISVSCLSLGREKFHPDYYCFWQFNRRELVVRDHALYGLEYQGNIEAANRDFIYGVFLNYQIQGHKVGPQMMGSFMDEEELYWIDHEERTITLEDPEDTDFIEYVVQSGDTLWGISRQFYGTGIRYAEIEEENAGVLSGHEYLMPGMVLRIRK